MSVLPAHKAFKAKSVLPVPLEPKAFRASKATPAQPALWVPLVQLAPSEQPDQPALSVPLELKALPAQPVQPGLSAQPARKVRASRFLVPTRPMLNLSLHIQLATLEMVT